MDELNIVAGVARVVKLVAVVGVFVLWEVVVVVELVVTVMLLALWVVSAVGISGMGSGIGVLVVRMVA